MPSFVILFPPSAYNFPVIFMQICYEGKKRLKWFLRIVIAVAVLTVAIILFVHGKSGESGDIDVFNEKISEFAVTVNLTGSEKEEDKRLLYASLNGCGVKAAVFCSCDYIEAHKSELSEAIKNGHSLCMLLTVPDGSNKYELMRYIAAENDRFFALTGKYPAYVRTTKTVSSDVAEILDKYGQILCNKTVKCTVAGCEYGSIVEAEAASSAEVCALIKTVTEWQSSGMQCVTLSAVIAGAKNEITH